MIGRLILGNATYWPALGARASRLENWASKLCLNAAAASALSITTRAQQVAVDLVALEMHRRPMIAFRADLDAGRFSEIPKDLCRLAIGKLGAVEIDAHRDTSIGGT